MKCISLSCLLFLICSGLLQAQESAQEPFTIAFGSCDNQRLPNLLWDDVMQNKPDVWIWGGDNIYSDTDDMHRMAADYAVQKSDSAYLALAKQAKILAIWDDHDYGKNDGGVEWEVKDEAQQLFLDFIDVPHHDARRKRAGIYHSETLNLPQGSIKIILLDTRYFRDALEKSPTRGRRYEPTADTTKTVLGEAQWAWLKDELKNSKADFNILVSSIQFLSAKHGFETWGNFPNEIRKLEKTIVESGAKGVLILSGDRHIAEFSEKKIDGLPYPLVDFTSSGLTHVYKGFKGEENPYRMGEVTNVVNFGLLKFDFETHRVQFELRGDQNVRLQSWERVYE
ncbi:MAG: alkaline phosphatase D family protein [Flavobacteriaceae bacterium]|nr:alkaline phosphatase D family protein [Flavobacteriaceae bacterium]